MNLGIKISPLRRNRQITQEELAAQLGVAPNGENGVSQT